MVFRYGFYPHAGSWREADVVRAGYEFDNPLTAVAPSGLCGTLGSFLRQKEKRERVEEGAHVCPHCRHSLTQICLTITKGDDL